MQEDGTDVLDVPGPAGTRRFNRVGWIALLLVCYVAISVFFQVLLKEETVFTHFAYIPLVLAGLWWGRRGVVVSVILAVVVLAFHFLGIATARLWSDVGRIFFFFLIGTSFGLVGEVMAAGRNALQVSERRLRQLIEKSLAGIFVYREDVILFTNPKFDEILGFSSGENVGKPIWDLISEEDMYAVTGSLEKQKAGEISDLHFEVRLLRKDGGLIWADVASSPVEYDGREAVLVNLYDITARREAEEKETRLREQLVHSARLAELGEMAAGVAHELNQPLTGIRNFAKNAIYMFENDAGSREEVLENLGRISDQVDRAAKIIVQMREMTRKTEQETAPVDINQAVGEILEFLGPELKQSRIDVDVRLEEDLPPVPGDKVRIEQVLLNILNNAVHSMETRPVKRLDVATRAEGGPNGSTVVEIRDSGVGFSPKDVEKLFTPFYSTRDPGRGTGLGLSISLSIMKAHGGTIEALGVPGEGATFRIRFPAQGGGESAENAE